MQPLGGTPQRRHPERPESCMVNAKPGASTWRRSEEHTSALQSRFGISYAVFYLGYGDHRDLHSFPTRRSSDLWGEPPNGATRRVRNPVWSTLNPEHPPGGDRKSTRLHSSHVSESRMPSST